MFGKRIHFNALPKVTRQRLTDSITGSESPAPLISNPTRGVLHYILWSVVAFIVLLISHFVLQISRSYRGSWDYQGTGYLIFYFIAFWIVGYSILAIVRRIIQDRSLPFQRGIYVFPTDIVDAHSSDLLIYPLEKLIRIGTRDKYTTNQEVERLFDFYFPEGKVITLNASDDSTAAYLQEIYTQSQTDLAEAINNQDAEKAHSLDIFFEARENEVWNSAGIAKSPSKIDGEPKARKVPIFLAWSSISAIAISLLAIPLWYGRNAIADERGFQAAMECGRTNCFDRYLRNPGRHEQEVRDVHLPAAAFEEARRSTTVTALRDFILAHPNAPQVPEARQIIHRRFERVRQDFASQASTTHSEMLPFMTALLAWLEQHDSPPVQVRFNAPSAESLRSMDATLGSEVTPIAPHFTPQRSEPRERYITGVLRRGFSEVFPNDVMRLEHFGRVGPNNPPDDLHAVFEVTYTVRPSGQIYVDREDRRQFVGIFNDFVVRMSIPGSTQTFTFNLSVEPPQTFTVSYERFGSADVGPSAGAVYTTMAERAFERLGTQLPLVFFRPDTRAYRQAIRRQERQRTERRPTKTPSSQQDLQELLDRMRREGLLNDRNF